MTETPDLAKPVERIRERLAGSTWYAARKRVIKKWREGKTVAWLCRAFKVSRQWVHKWINRWLTEGRTWDALRDRSTRPHRIHRKRDAHVDTVIQARLDHPRMGAAKLRAVARLALSHDTIHKILVQAGLVKPGKKRGWTRIRRFQRPFPNYLWQLDSAPSKLGGVPAR